MSYSPSSHRRAEGQRRRCKNGAYARTRARPSGGIRGIVGNSAVLRWVATGSHFCVGRVERPIEARGRKARHCCITNPGREICSAS